MPKETIHTSNYPGDGIFDVKVGWTRDMAVQVGVAEADGRSMWWVYGGELKAELGDKIIEIVSKRTICENIFEEHSLVGEDILNLLDMVCGSFDSMWATMDRKEVNQLIRVLRRARDSAFGKDE